MFIFRAWGILIKKTLKSREQEREDIKIARAKFSKLQRKIGAHRFVCLDKSSAKTNMTPLHGRAKNGERCFDSAAHGHWKSMTMLSLMRSDGETQCMFFDGATNKETLKCILKSYCAQHCELVILLLWIICLPIKVYKLICYT